MQAKAVMTRQGVTQTSRKWPPLPVTLYFLLILIPVEFDVGPVFFTGIRALLLCLALPMMMKVFRGEAGPLNPADGLFLAFGLWNIFTLFFNSPDQAISFGGSIALEILGGYAVTRVYVRTAADFIAMCRMLFWAVGISLPFAIYESQTGVAPIPEWINKLPFFYSFPDFYNEAAGQRLGLERAQVIFAHPIHYGLFCSTALSFAFVGFKGLTSHFMRYVLTVLSVTGVFFSLSSGAILPMVLQFGLIFWAWMARGTEKRWVILMALTATAYVIVDLLSNRTPIQVFLSYATFSPHNAYWRILIFEWGMKNVWANPWIGIGMNSWERAWFMHSGSMDNYWLVVAVRYGIPGFLMLASGYCLIILAVARRKLDGDPVLLQLRRAWVFTLFSLVLTLCTVDVWATALSYVFFLFGSGVWLLSARPSTEVAPTVTANTMRQPRTYARNPQGHYSRFGVTSTRGSKTHGSS